MAISRKKNLEQRSSISEDLLRDLTGATELVMQNKASIPKPEKKEKSERIPVCVSFDPDQIVFVQNSIGQSITRKIKAGSNIAKSTTVASEIRDMVDFLQDITSELGVSDYHELAEIVRERGAA